MTVAVFVLPFIRRFSRLTIVVLLLQLFSVFALTEGVYILSDPLISSRLREIGIAWMSFYLSLTVFLNAGGFFLTLYKSERERLAGVS
jgi:hypothetical protein